MKILVGLLTVCFAFTGTFCTNHVFAQEASTAYIIVPADQPVVIPYFDDDENTPPEPDEGEDVVGELKMDDSAELDRELEKRLEDERQRERDDDERRRQREQDDDKRKRFVEESFGPWPTKSIHETRLSIRETSDDAPRDRSDQLVFGENAADWNSFIATPKVFAWAAPDIRYQPLYFEDVALERYGQTAGWHQQPYHSGVDFFKSFVFWPNQMRHDHIYSCDSPLGFCRPGSPCVPKTRQLQFFGF